MSAIPFSKSRNRIAVAAVSVVLLLSGCIHEFLVARETASARWQQPEVFEDFPASGDIYNYEVWEHGPPFNSKVADRSEDQYRLRIEANETGNVYFEVKRQFGISNETAWEHLEQAFQELGLPEPALNRSHEFTWG